MATTISLGRRRWGGGKVPAQSAIRDVNPGAWAGSLRTRDMLSVFRRPESPTIRFYEEDLAVNGLRSPDDRIRVLQSEADRLLSS
jgi:hypothetical protein